MIKNIIFDIGGVLMEFDTLTITAAFADDDEDIQLLHREIFQHPDWVSMDRGRSDSAVLQSVQTRLPVRLHRVAEQIMSYWDEQMKPDPYINALAEELAHAGYSLYILSNTSCRFYRFQDRIPAWPWFKGRFLSFEEQLLKPDLQFFRVFFLKFGLCPSECFFIDDSLLNIEAADWLGMPGCLYRGDIRELREMLRRAGVPDA